jgi:hypothetical protein
MNQKREFIVKLIEFLGGKTYIERYGGMWLSEYREIQREKCEMGLRVKML